MEHKFNPIQTNQMSKREKIKNLFWLIVSNSIFRFTPPYLTFFRKWRIVLLKLFGSEIEWTVSIHPKAKIEYPWNLKMGHLSSLGEKSWIYAMAPIQIGEKTCIGKEAYLLTGSHDITSSTFDLIIKPIKIGNCCWLTTGVTVLPGINIGDGCVIAANSTIVKNVDAWNVVGGNPAKFIKKRVIKDA